MSRKKYSSSNYIRLELFKNEKLCFLQKENNNKNDNYNVRFKV